MQELKRTDSNLFTGPIIELANKIKEPMNEKEYLVEQVGLLWMLTGGEIEGAEIYSKLTDIPSRFFDSIKIIPESK